MSPPSSHRPGVLPLQRPPEDGPRMIFARLVNGVHDRDHARAERCRAQLLELGYVVAFAEWLAARRWRDHRGVVKAVRAPRSLGYSVQPVTYASSRGMPQADEYQVKGPASRPGNAGPKGQPPCRHTGRPR